MKYAHNLVLQTGNLWKGQMIRTDALLAHECGEKGEMECHILWLDDTFNFHHFCVRLLLFGHTFQYILFMLSSKTQGTRMGNHLRLPLHMYI